MHCKFFTVPCEKKKEREKWKNTNTVYLRMPLYHFVTADLPTNTKAPELDDTNAAAALRADASWSGIDASAGSGVTEDLMGLYLAYLVSIGFLPPPPQADTAPRKLPAITITEEQKKTLANIGGRGGAA